MPRTRARSGDECSRPDASLKSRILGTRERGVHPPSPMMRTSRLAAAPAGGSTAWRPLLTGGASVPALCRGRIDKCLRGRGQVLERQNLPDDRGAEVDVEDGRKGAEVKDHLASRHVGFINGRSQSCPLWDSLLWALTPDPQDFQPDFDFPTPKIARATCPAGRVHPARPLLRQLLTKPLSQKETTPSFSLKKGDTGRGLPPSKPRSFLHHLPCRATSRPWRAAFEQRDKTSVLSTIAKKSAFQ